MRLFPQSGWVVIPKQRFFQKPGYVPKVYGYGRDPNVGWRVRIKRYAKLRGLAEPEFLKEPKSKKAMTAPLRMRPLGICEKLKPTDHLIVDTIEDLTMKGAEIPEIDLWMSERGIRWHVVDLFGCSLDSGSVMGRKMLSDLGLCRELLAIERAGKWVKIRERARAEGRYMGVYGESSKLFFCKAVPCEGGVRLELEPWALPLMKEAACGHKIANEIRYIYKYNRLSQRMAERKAEQMLTFYMAWQYQGFPDINTVAIEDMISAYEEKKYGA